MNDALVFSIVIYRAVSGQLKYKFSKTLHSWSIVRNPSNYIFKVLPSCAMMDHRDNTKRSLNVLTSHILTMRNKQDVSDTGGWAKLCTSQPGIWQPTY